MPMSRENTFRVTLIPSQVEFDSDANETLLQAALRAQVPLASSCRNGTCRTCLAKLTEGRVVYRIEWPGLSAEEKSDGFILPCVAHAVSDVVFEPQ